MAHRFKKHFTREEARALLPEVRTWLDGLKTLRGRMLQLDEQIGKLLEDGRDAGGPVVNQWIQVGTEMQRLLREFQRREIQVKDLDRGLIDFPAIVAGREVFLCWEQDEDDIEFWHDLDTGYAGRERL